MWVNCPMCGAPGGWESEQEVRYCGTCEERYQETRCMLEEEQRVHLERELDYYHEEHPIEHVTCSKCLSPETVENPKFYCNNCEKLKLDDVHRLLKLSNIEGTLRIIIDHMLLQLKDVGAMMSLFGGNKNILGRIDIDDLTSKLLGLTAELYAEYLPEEDIDYFLEVYSNFPRLAKIGNNLQVVMPEIFKKSTEFMEGYLADVAEDIPF